MRINICDLILNGQIKAGEPGEIGKINKLIKLLTHFSLTNILLT